MTPSLYQSGSSEVVLEVALTANLSADLEDVRRDDVRIELHVVPRAVPHVPRTAQEVVGLERPRAIEVEFFEIEVEPPRLRVVRVEVDHADDDVVFSALAVAE